jgi:hypothetical protein
LVGLTKIIGYAIYSMEVPRHFGSGQIKEIAAAWLKTQQTQRKGN